MTHYAILNLTTPHVLLIVIKEQYKALSEQYSVSDRRPDYQQPLTDKAMQWAQIEHAYTTLIDDKKRVVYDQVLEKIGQIKYFLSKKNYSSAKKVFFSFENVMQSLFFKPPYYANSLLANDDLLQLATLANNLATSAENQASINEKIEKSHQLFVDAEQFYRIALVLRKYARLRENRPTKCEINAVSNLCNFLHGRAEAAKRARNLKYADQLNDEKEKLLNDFLVLFPDAILQMKSDEEDLLDSGTDFFEAYINLAIFYQEKGSAAKATRYFLQSLEICHHMNDHVTDPQSKIVILENEMIVLRKFSELIPIEEIQTLLDKYLQRYSELSSDAKQNFLFPIQKSLSFYLSTGQWELVKKYFTHALMLLKEITETSYSAAILLHLDCATILARDFGLTTHTEQPMQISVAPTDKIPLQPQNIFTNVATILHHYRMAMNYAIYSRDLDSALLICEKIAAFYTVLSKQHPRDQTQHAALAQFFQAMTHFKVSDIDKKTFNQIRICYQKIRSTALLRNTCLQICVLYKKKYRNNDDPHLVHSEKFGDFMDTLMERATIPFWKLPPPTQHKTEKLKRLNKKKEHIAQSCSSSPAITEQVSIPSSFTEPTNKLPCRKAS